LSQDNQSCLRFSLEESLWFRKGQEVAELVSISLDPDITIQENEQYVTIRGSLELTGEYKSYEDSEVNEEENVTYQKYVERVDPLEEGNCEFSHRFPVDITIPNNRIQSIYDIDVVVESFDYSFPERSCLKLSSELMISGLYDSSQQELAVEVVEEVEEAAEEEVQELEVLHRNQEEIEVEVPQEEQPEVVFEDTFLFEAEARKPKEEEKPEAFPKLPTFTYQPQDEVEQPAFLETRSEASPPPPEEVVEEEVVDEVQEQETEVQEAPKEPVVEAEEETVEESSSSEEKHPKHIFKKKPGKKKTMTLTEFFARKDETTEQARLKVCIVQKGDTLDSLAERYDVSVPNLLRVNNLELNEDVYEGQVLYVPVPAVNK